MLFSSAKGEFWKNSEISEQWIQKMKNLENESYV